MTPGTGRASSGGMTNMTLQSPRSTSMALLGLLALGLWLSASPERAGAQRDPRGDAPRDASSPNEVAQPDERPSDDDTDLATATPDPTPEVPRLMQRPASEARVDVVEQAGVGGPTAYASGGVLEVGGSGSLFATEAFAGLRFAPFVTWFAFDGIAFSYIHELYGGKREDGRWFAMNLQIEASAHLRVSDRLLVLLGVAPGLLYNGDHTGFSIKPRAGLDVLVGRSGVLHPAIYFLAATEELVAPVDSVPATHWGYGLEIAYGAMF